MKNKKYKTKSDAATLRINENFVPYYTKTLDSKKRITLGGKLAKTLGKTIKIEAYQVFLGSNGDILLRPTVSIPSQEAWIYQNSDVISKIRQGLNEASEGQTEKASDIDSFIEDL